MSNPIKRIRWATHRATGAKGERKRQSLMDRLHTRTGSGSSVEKKRESQGKESTDFPAADSSDSASEQLEGGGRTIYFNRPLPPEARDEEGKPLARYSRNKIRTAKYTPLSFIPKNLWFQFHNVANIYFLFIIILGVCSPELDMLHRSY